MRIEQHGDWTFNYLDPDEIEKIKKVDTEKPLLLESRNLDGNTLRCHTSVMTGMDLQRRLENAAEKCELDIVYL